MALVTDYPTLVAEVASWLHRPDLADKIPQMIFYAENQINSELRHLKMEERWHITTEPGQDFIDLPDNYQEMRNLQINLGNRTQVLTYQSPENMDLAEVRGFGVPEFYSVVGYSLQLSPIPAAEYDLEMHYYKRFDHLSEDNPTNFLTQEASDLLLFGALAHAEAFRVNDERVSQWGQAYGQRLKQMNREHKKARYTGSSLQMRIEPSYVK